MLANIADIFISLLEENRRRIFPDSPETYGGIISDSAYTALNLISRSDALYHDVEHTCMVTLCGQDIFLGKKLLEGQLRPNDWLHFTISLLFHDIGYVRNILKGDLEDRQIIDSEGNYVELDSNSTDASLTSYHVERGKMFLNQRVWNPEVNVEFLCDLISFTQFPVPETRSRINRMSDEKTALANLVGSSDLIGQLADPHYDKKIPSLFYEFLETGTAAKLGYRNPGDLRTSYPSFFYNFVKPHILNALAYLNVTERGRQWVANLNFHVFSEMHRAILGPTGVQLIQEIADIYLEKNEVDELFQHMLKKVCEYQNWPVGHVYKVSKINGEVKIEPTKVWFLSTSLSSISNFKEITSRYNFAVGEGLPGRVVLSGSPAWIEDVTVDTNFPRARQAEDIGVRGAFGFPIFGNSDVEFVIECFSLKAEKPDDSVLSLMHQVSYEMAKSIANLR